MSDLISREKALDGLKYEMKYGAEIDRCGLDTAYDIIENLPSTEPEPKWIPFKFRGLTEEEKEWHPDWDYMMDCQLPENEQEILVSDGKYVWFDTFYNDNDGCCLDSDMDLDGIAWMPLPEPWRGE